jgi:hypothetical protein
MLKVKLPDGTVFSMSIFVKGSLDDYLQHIIAVLCLINQKGLDAQCKQYAKEMKTASAALGALKQKSIGPQELSSKKDQEALKTKKTLTQEMLTSATKGNNETVAATYELLRNLLAANHRPSGIASSKRCTSVTRGLVQMARSMTKSALGATLLF